MQMRPVGQPGTAAGAMGVHMRPVGQFGTAARDMFVTVVEACPGSKSTDMALADERVTVQDDVAMESQPTHEERWELVPVAVRP